MCPWTEYEMSITDLDNCFNDVRTLPSLINRLKELSEENEKLRALQDDMLSGIDRFHPAPDSAIVEKVAGLRGLIRIFSKTYARQLKSIKEGPSVQDRLKGRTLTALIDDSMWKDSRNVVLLAESVIWKKVIDDIFWSPFQIFGERLEDTWKAIFDEGKLFSNLHAASEAESPQTAGKQRMPIPLLASNRKSGGMPPSFT